MKAISPTVLLTLGLLFILLGLVFVGASLSQATNPHAAIQQQHGKTKPNADNAASNQEVAEGGDQEAKGWLAMKKYVRECWEGFVSIIKRDDNDKVVVALSTFVIAAFTIALFFATYFLYAGGERHSEKELRAYVTVAPAGLANIDPTKNAIVALLVLNGGKTPAHGAENEAVLALLPHPLPPKFPFPQLKSARQSKYIISPGFPFGTNAIGAQPFTQNEWIEILQAPATGGRRLYVFGQVDYVDIFGNKRWTRFCISFAGRHDLIPLAQQGNWVAIGQLLAQTGQSLSFEFAPQHNEAN